MKKTILTLSLLILILALAACSGTGAASETGSQEAAPVSGQTNGEENVDPQNQPGIPTETVLALGTVKLDETDHAVDAGQAAELLPLWKALRSFSESETAAQAEVEAIVSQIEDTMTPEQISAIESMELTMQDLAGVGETLGIEMSGMGPGGFGGEITDEMRATMEAARESGEFQRPGGDMPAGMGPGGGQGLGGEGGQMDPAARETAMAERGGTRGARSGLNTELLDGIIAFLEAKIQ